MIVKETKLVSLKRLKGGVFTVDKASDSGRTLCDYCATACCDVRAMLDETAARGTITLTSSCISYQPPLLFQNQHGLFDGSNTLRLGSAWYKRVKKGDWIGLVDARSKEVFGEAKIGRVVCGTRDEIIAKHSRKNHLYFQDDIGKMEAAIKMRKLLPAIYGNLIFKNATTATVIYFSDVYL